MEVWYRKVYRSNWYDLVFVTGWRDTTNHLNLPT